MPNVSFMSQMTTRKPASESCSATLAPMPVDPPVINAIFFFIGTSFSWSLELVFLFLKYRNLLSNLFLPLRLGCWEPDLKFRFDH